jgi:transcription elongation GreA/GreB family factor
VQFDPTTNDGLRSPQVERGGWVRLRGLRPIGEDVVFLDDARTPPPLHAHVISPTSLLGRLLIGCRVGETVVFDAAGGRVALTILDAGRATPIGRAGCHENGLRPS